MIEGLKKFQERWVETDGGVSLRKMDNTERRLEVAG
jgi:hypothetical protein